MEDKIKENTKLDIPLIAAILIVNIVITPAITVVATLVSTGIAMPGLLS